METTDKAQAAVEELYHFREHYFENFSIEEAAQKNDKIKEKMNVTLQVLESLADEFTNKAVYNMLLGKALNVLPHHSQEAEEALSKAVKLDPKLVVAWNHLGECYWKSGNIPSAKNCFSGALSHSKNKESLRNLSMVLRQGGSFDADRHKMVEESVEKAKEAVQMDIQDGMSWLCLGNAYLSMFFAEGQNPKTMKQCMSAYSQAEKDPVVKNNPDLQFNRAMAYKYQEEFQSALEGLHRAGLLDPSWPDPHKKESSLLSFLTKVDNLVKTKGKFKEKKLQTLLQSIKESDLGPYGGGTYVRPKASTVNIAKCPLRSLKEDVNLETVILGKVVCTVTTDDPAPFTFCLVDEEETCLPVNVYNIAQGTGVKIGDSVAIPEPFVQKISVDHQGTVIQLNSVRVVNPLVMVVNGRKLGPDKHAPLLLSVKAFSE